MNETHLKLLRECVAAGARATKGEWRPGRSDMTSYELDGTAFKNVYGPDATPHPHIPGQDVPVSVARGETELCHENAAFIAAAANARDALTALLAEYEAMQAEIARLRDALDDDGAQAIGHWQNGQLVWAVANRHGVAHVSDAELRTWLATHKDPRGINQYAPPVAVKWMFDRWAAANLVDAALQNPKEPTNGK